MTDRTIVYDTAIPQTTDILNTSKFAMLGDAFLAMAAFGNSATAPSQVVAGLACTQTTVASLNVNVGPGCIFQLDAVDATAYGDLGTDTNHVYKMGIREATGTLAITPPSTSGFSQVFLVQAILSDIDAGSMVESYYNSSNPAAPYSGPANDGLSQFTTRTCVCTIGLKAGVAAATGSQATPSPDVGYIGLYAITVANGAASVVQANIVPLNGGFAPFVNTALPYIPAGVQAGSWMYGVDTGTANNAIVTLAPVPAAYTPGMTIRVKMLFAPTGPAVINCNGLGNKPIVGTGGLAVTLNEWAIGDIIQLIFDGTNFQINSNKQPGAPTYLQAAQTFYVNASTGSDANDGLASTVGGGHGPWATLTHASDFINTLNLNGFNITVNVADGTYSHTTRRFIAPSPGGQGNILWIGNPTTPTNCIISATNWSCIAAQGGSHSFSGFKLTCSGTTVNGDTGCGLNASFGVSSVTLDNINYGAVFGAHILVDRSARLQLTGTHTISGTAAGNSFQTAAFVNAFESATVEVNSSALPALVVTANVTYSIFVAALENANVILFFSSITGSGVVTGQKYSATLNGIINTNGGGVNYYPGSSAGSTASGGQYV